MRALRPRLGDGDLALAALGGGATVLAAFVSVQLGAEMGVGAVLVAAAFATTLLGFVAFPHLAVAATIAVFALIPMLKVFVAPEIGALKDLMVLAAAIAGFILYAYEGRRPDRFVAGIAAMILGLYALNVGGSHDAAWVQGVRLVAEPLILLLVGFVLPDPRRTFRYAMVALIAVCCAIALYGGYQQAVGKFALVEWGYSFESQVRSLPSGQLRSFGTLDDPFTYAALLTFGLAAVLFWLRRGPVAWAAALLLATGIALSFVRTAFLIIVAFAGLVLQRWGYQTSAVLTVAATLIAGLVLLVNASGTQSQAFPVGSAEGDAAAVGTTGTVNVILNGRISAWQAALGDEPPAWFLGRGVGEVGTAAERATYTIASDEEIDDGAEIQAVDSGYLAVIADVGFIGLCLLLALFGRLLLLAWAATREVGSAGWVALGLLAALLLDALTRASFTGFPTAYLSLLIVGICLASAREARVERSRAASATG